MTWVFQGDPDAYHWVTDASIKQAAYKVSTEYGNQVSALIGENNPPQYAKASNIIKGGVNKEIKTVGGGAGNPLNSGNGQFFSDYSPLVLQDQFLWGTGSNDPNDIDTYYLTVMGQCLTLSADGNTIYCADQFRTAKWVGNLPKEFPLPYGVNVDANTSPPTQLGVVSTSAGYPTNLVPFKPTDCGVIIKVGTLTVSVNRRTDYASGDIFYVPLPDIPPDFPPVPVFECEKGDPGPPGPAGPPGSDASVTIEAMDNAVKVADPVQLVAFLNDASIVSGNTPNNLENVYSNILPDHLSAINEIALRNDTELWFPKPTLTFELEEAASFTVETSAKLLPFYRLALPAAVIAALVASLQTIKVPVCVQGAIGPTTLNDSNRVGDVMSEQSLPFPVLDVQGGSQLLFFQWLANAIGALMRCCPPCEPPAALVHVGVFDGPGVYDSTPYQIERFHFSVQQPTKVPRDTIQSVSDIGKYGRFRMLYEDGTLGELDFINSIDERRLTKNATVKGIEVTPLYGVTIDLFVQYVEPRDQIGGYGRP